MASKAFGIICDAKLGKSNAFPKHGAGTPQGATMTHWVEDMIKSESRSVIG
ncbi:MAG: hypothetical protein Q7U60_10200 [Candidatus Methanoperedens sp.]|nr:hypothetical protein [Candidatus Methanoperedens sp.]